MRSARSAGRLQHVAPPRGRASSTITGRPAGCRTWHCKQQDRQAAACGAAARARLEQPDQGRQRVGLQQRAAVGAAARRDAQRLQRAQAQAGRQLRRADVLAPRHCGRPGPVSTNEPAPASRLPFPPSARSRSTDEPADEPAPASRPHRDSLSASWGMRQCRTASAATKAFVCMRCPRKQVSFAHAAVRALSRAELATPTASACAAARLAATTRAPQSC